MAVHAPNGKHYLLNHIAVSGCSKSPVSCLWSDVLLRWHSRAPDTHLYHAEIRLYEDAWVYSEIQDQRAQSCTADGCGISKESGCKTIRSEHHQTCRIWSCTARKGGLG